MTSPPIAITARLSAELKADGDAYADRLGLSFNALLVVALRDYLDGRKVMHQAPSDAPKVRRVAKTATALAAPLPGPFKAPPGRRQPCPCANGKQWRHCHGLSSL